MEQLKILPAASELAKIACDAIYSEIANNTKRYTAVNGSIRVIMTPLCAAANEMVESINDWKKLTDDKGNVYEPANVSWVFPLQPSKSKEQHLTDKDHLERVSTDAYTAMQAAYEFLKQLHNDCGADIKELDQQLGLFESNGWAKREGAFIARILNIDYPEYQQKFMDICISIMGNSAVKDRELAQIGLRAIADVLHSNGHFIVEF